jgi:branched-chain amino acid aminotransferase
VDGIELDGVSESSGSETRGPSSLGGPVTTLLSRLFDARVERAHYAADEA